MSDKGKAPEAPKEPGPHEVEMIYVAVSRGRWQDRDLFMYGGGHPKAYRTKELALAGCSEGDIVLTCRVMERARKRVHTCAEAL